MKRGALLHAHTKMHKQLKGHS